MQINYSVFEYLYRDASNYKAWGSILLIGEITPDQVQSLKNTLHEQQFFIAEQIGLPPMYETLWRYSKGPTIDDHPFHEFFEFRAATTLEISSIQPWGTTINLLHAFHNAENTWNPQLSPHWNLERLGAPKRLQERLSQH